MWIRESIFIHHWVHLKNDWFPFASKRFIQKDTSYILCLFKNTAKNLNDKNTLHSKISIQE